ncbi:MAG: 50S ribosomal protein L10 [Candidatus Paceibacterota bacterium]
MAKTKVQKEKAVKILKDKLEKNNGFILVGFSGLEVNELNDLRREIQNSGGHLRVAKKNLLKLAFKENNIDFSFDEDYLGQTAFVVFENLPEIAGAVFDFSKDNDINILGGFNLNDQNPLEADYITKIGQLPSRKVLLGQIVGSISSPIRSFIYAIKQISEVKN